MHRVVVLPRLKGREHEETQRRAEPPVGALGGEERSVRAVVKDDERAYQEPRSRDGEHERDQVRDLQREIHEHEQHEVRQDRRQQTAQAAPSVGAGIGLKRVAPESTPSAWQILLSRRVCWRPPHLVTTAGADQPFVRVSAGSSRAAGRARTRATGPGRLTNSWMRSTHAAPQCQHEFSCRAIGAPQVRHRRGKSPPRTAQRSPVFMSALTRVPSSSARASG
jgi:hypothetical protein